ncbi:hypothetical protein ACJJTC_002859 [Scirpophaga incertulas]
MYDCNYLLSANYLFSRKVATSTPARPVTAPAPASSRPAKAVAGGATRPDTPSHARPGSAPATALKKTPTNVPKPTTSPIGTKADLQGNVEKITKPRVPPQKVDDQTTPRLPTTYADKIKRITNWQLAAKLIPKEPRLTKQKSLDSIQLSQPKPSTSRSQDTLQLISFDRSARTVSPSNLKPTAPTAFPSIHRQEEQDEAAKTRESRKRQLEADESTATQPARPKMQPPAIPTIVTTPPDTLQPQDRQPRTEARTTLDADINVETVPATAPARSAVPPKVQEPRESIAPRTTGADTRNKTKPSEAPVVAASTQRTKAKPATSEQASRSTEQTTANTIEEVISLLKSAFVSVMAAQASLMAAANDGQRRPSKRRGNKKRKTQPQPQPVAPSTMTAATKIKKSRPTPATSTEQLVEVDVATRPRKTRPVPAPRDRTAENTAKEDQETPRREKASARSASTSTCCNYHHHHYTTSTTPGYASRPTTGCNYKRCPYYEAR